MTDKTPLHTVAEQVLRDMASQGLLIEWHTLLRDALDAANSEDSADPLSDEWIAERMGWYPPANPYTDDCMGARVKATIRAALASRDAELAKLRQGEPVAIAVLQLPPLTDIMYHAVRGFEYEFTSGGPESITGYMDDDMLDEIWDHINTALRVAQLGGSNG